MVRMPMELRRSTALGPMPHSRPTSIGGRSTSTLSGSITVSPSGLFMSEASLARNLFGATPTEAVRPVSEAMRCLRRMPISVAGPSSRMLPVTSRKASSRLSGSTSGVTESKIDQSAGRRRDSDRTVAGR